MCRLSSSEYDLYGRTNSRRGRSLFTWLRELWGPRRPQVEEAEVLRFPAGTSARPDQSGDPRDSKAA